MRNAMLLALAVNSLGVSLAQVGPGANSFEIDGDYGASILGDGRVSDDGHVTFFPPLEGQGEKWEHVAIMPFVSPTAPHTIIGQNYPYMGTYCYRADCDAKTPTSGIKDRSEQKILDSWALKGGSRYFSFSMYVPDRDIAGNEHGFEANNWFFFCQWWQDSSRQPPLSIGYSPADNKIVLARRYDDDAFQALADAGQLVRNQWYHFLVRAEFGLDATGTGAGNVGFWMMDPATGLWNEIYVNDALRLGWKYKDDGVTLADTENFNWKVGTYRGASSFASSIRYDNIRFGRTWDLVTKGKLVGYHKNVAELQLDESSGTTANDASAYANPGTLVGGPVRETGGIVGNCVKLDGVDDHVRVPVDTTDFDFGNYMTLSGWFKSSDSPQAAKAIICTDEYSTTYKSRLYLVSGNELSFTVRHPDNTLETVQQTLGSSVLDGQWHHFVGTYNRWAPDGNRLKIYLDGNLIGSAAGADKPLLRPDNYVYAGKFSGNYFKGRIDEIGLYNYEMTAAEVAALFASP